MAKRDPCPLSWPDGWKRTSPSRRQRSRFDGSHFVRARDGVLKELRLMRAAHVVITSDLPVKSNGMPYATGRADDPGIAVWWIQDGKERVMACDRYMTPGENLRAIQLSIGALRGLARWGATEIVDRAFAGFAALPPGSGVEVNVAKDWWDVLEIDKDLFTLQPEDLFAIAKQRYKKLVLIAHPDRGGSVAKMTELEKALGEAEAYLQIHADNDQNGAHADR